MHEPYLIPNLIYCDGNTAFGRNDKRLRRNLWVDSNRFMHQTDSRTVTIYPYNLDVVYRYNASAYIPLPTDRSNHRRDGTTNLPLGENGDAANADGML